MSTTVLQSVAWGMLGVIALLVVALKQKWSWVWPWNSVETLRREREDLLSLLATDDLTDARSRRYLADRVDRSPRTQDHFLAVIDLDDFKGVNDGYGHHTGDALLAKIAQGLVALCRPGDFVARLGGDEFCVFFEGSRAEAAHRLAERMREVISTLSVESDGTNVSRSASIGITRLTPDQQLADALNLADVALYEAKNAGRNLVRFADKSVWETIRTRRERPTVEELSGALDRGEVRYHVQPIFELATKKAVGVEALIRWERPDGTILMPDEFLDIMTANYHRNLRPPLQFANEVGRTFTGSQTPIYCTWNISTRFLEMEVDSAEGWIKKLLNGLEPQHTVFEIVESAIIRDVAATRRLLHALRETGVRIALDDFGTGYSNLERLLSLPIDIVKLDRSFVRNLSKDQRTRVIVDGLVSIADALGFDIVAEGVEEQGQLDTLADLNIKFAQGFLLGKPQPVADWQSKLAEPFTQIQNLELDSTG